jgi:hypothetical protein
MLWHLVYCGPVHSHLFRRVCFRWKIWQCSNQQAIVLKCIEGAAARPLPEYACTQGIGHLGWVQSHLLVVLLVCSCLLPSQKFARTLRRTCTTQRVWLQGRTRTRPAVAGLVALLTTERACMLMIRK